MFRRSLVAAVLTLAVAALTLAVAIPTLAGVVQVDVRALFDSDVILNNGTGVLDPTQQSIDLALTGADNFCFPTQSAAVELAVPPQTPDGVVDDAFYAATGRHPDVQLWWDNADDGLNARRIVAATGGFAVDVPPGLYSEVHLLATSGDTGSNLDIVMSYTDGLSAPTSVLVPDWFDDPVATDDVYFLHDGLDRVQPGSGPGELYRYEDPSDPAIFGLRILADPTRTLEQVLVDRTDTTGVFNFFGLTGVTAEPEGCCFPDGTCEDLDAGACAARGGAAQGTGTDCVGTTCPPPSLEACCFTDGTCQDLEPADCATRGGTAQGAGTDCTGTPCPPPGLPGQVPNGAGRPGEPLRVSKGATAPELDLTWDVSCSAAATEAFVYEGTFGSWYDHVPNPDCLPGGALTSVTLTPGAEDRYYLVVPATATAEGSYGVDSFGFERPVSLTSCVPQVLGCP